MEKSTFLFHFAELELDVSKIEKAIGYKDDEKQEMISGLIKDVLGDAEKICNIRAEYNIFTDVHFNDSDKTVDVEQVSLHVQKTVYGQIRKSELVALFLCTAGGEIGNLSRKFMNDGDLLTGYIYDVIGSEIVEAAVDLMQNHLQKAMAEYGKRITNRYSPGYCGWDVKEQHKLFSLLPANFCEIRLNSSALMDPVKSISGIIGIGEKVKMNSYTCNICDNQNCIYRRKMEKYKTDS